jgi:pyridoxal phosphate enzyme (YggS family)
MNRQRLIADNLARIRGQIADAAEASGRTAADITLVAVTKYVGADFVQDLVECGCRDLGESRPQQLWEKTAAIDCADVRWHMIGHLQRNKVARTLPMVSMIHSLDSQRLMQAVNSAAEARRATSVGLLEINISGDESKHGWDPEELPALLARMNEFPHVTVDGLMAMASREGGLDRAQRDFAALRELRDSLQLRCPETVRLDQLSMGMSGDFTVAIRGGATIVRVGSALFEGVETD